MPDIRTALQEALSKTAQAWAADDEAHKQTEPQQEKAMTNTINDGRIVNNISRTVFTFVQGNPGINRQDARERLVAQGFKDSSVTSLLSQMVRTGMVRMTENGGLFVTRQEYAPIKPSKPEAKAKATRKVVHIVRKPRIEPVAEIEEPVPETRPSAVAILANMSVGEAFKLYQELHKMFGGK